MTRAERDEEWATRNERRTATKDNAKKKTAKRKAGARYGRGTGTKKVMPGRKKTRIAPQPTKKMAELMVFRKELTNDVAEALRKAGREAGITWFLTGVRQMLSRDGVDLHKDDPDWLGVVIYEAELIRDKLRALGLYPKD